MSGHMRLSVWRAEIHEDNDGQTYPDPDDDLPTLATGRKAWWGQYTAPGYMDRTDTSGPYASAAEAARETFALYGDDEPGSDDRRELAALLWQIRARGAL